MKLAVIDLLFTTANEFITSQVIIQKAVNNAIASYVSEIDIVQHVINTYITITNSEKNRIKTSEVSATFKRHNPTNTINNRECTKSLEFKGFKKTKIRGITSYKNIEWKAKAKSVADDSD